MNRPLILFGLAGLIVNLALAGSSSSMEPSTAEARPDRAAAALIVGPEQTENNCASCHELEAQAWRASRHHLGFTDRHSTDRAKEVLKNMGQRSMKRGDSNSCRDCHYTSLLSRDRLSPKWGVSCESCHAPAKNWVDVHNKQQGLAEGATIKWGEGREESLENHKARMKSSVTAGMLHPSMLYEIASNCLGCHVVPNEAVVNRGGHLAGSIDFDLVAWSQGEVRHNFLGGSSGSEHGRNALASPEKQRMMFIIGCLVDLEHTTRSLTLVEEEGGRFHKAMLDRASRLRTRLERIAQATEREEFSEILALLPSQIDASTGVDEEVPTRIAEVARGLQRDLGEVDLSATDPLLPSEFKGTPVE